MKFDRQNPDAAYRKGYLIGYREGYQDGMYGKPNISSDSKEELYCPIEAMGLSVRAYNCLHYAGCRYLIDVVNMEEDKIKQLRNLGKITALEIARWLDNHGITGTNWEFYLL